jgi:hypothetical protein
MEAHVACLGGMVTWHRLTPTEPMKAFEKVTDTAPHASHDLTSTLRLSYLSLVMILEYR